MRQASKETFANLGTQSLLISSECSSRDIVLEETWNMARTWVCMCNGGEFRSEKSEFQSLCDLHVEGAFMAQCGQWHKMEKKLVEIQMEDPISSLKKVKHKCFI